MKIVEPIAVLNKSFSGPYDLTPSKKLKADMNIINPIRKYSKATMIKPLRLYATNRFTIATINKMAFLSLNPILYIE